MTLPSTTDIPTDPFRDGGINAFAQRLRRGEITVSAVTEAYLGRIAALDARLGAFEHVDMQGARRQANALDALLRAGVDLGPLMGVPVAVKDLFAINGLPTYAGSRMPVGDVIGEEGSFVRKLKRSGCVILGTTKSVECAFGAAGINSVRGTPWNPWDAQTQRLPGGSSSGSAVAVAAGLCAFAIGTDTGGSVRVPAALCGIFGLKTTMGHWSTDGVFPLSTTLDSIGLLTRSAEDAALAFGALGDSGEDRGVTPVQGLRFGRVRGYVEEGIDPLIAQVLDDTAESLRQAGAHIQDVAMPEAAEREWITPAVLGTEILASLGRDRFLRHRDNMDPVVAARIAAALEVCGDDYVRALRRMQSLAELAHRRFAGLDAWLLPTSAVLPLPVAHFADLERALALSKQITQCSQPGNVFGLCGANVPLTAQDRLPIGLQLLAPAGQEMRLLSLARGLQAHLGQLPGPDLGAFLAQDNA